MSLIPFLILKFKINLYHSLKYPWKCQSFKEKRLLILIHTS